MVNTCSLQNLARVRLSEAKSPLSAGFADGAYYLAGYSVERGLKACHIHNLKDLVRVANLEIARLAQAKHSLYQRTKKTKQRPSSKQSIAPGTDIGSNRTPAIHRSNLEGTKRRGFLSNCLETPRLAQRNDRDLSSELDWHSNPDPSFPTRSSYQLCGR
jgi:hypothetical protein